MAANFCLGSYIISHIVFPIIKLSSISRVFVGLGRIIRIYMRTSSFLVTLIRINGDSSICYQNSVNAYDATKNSGDAYLFSPQLPHTFYHFPHAQQLIFLMGLYSKFFVLCKVTLPNHSKEYSLCESYSTGKVRTQDIIYIHIASPSGSV